MKDNSINKESELEKLLTVKESAEFVGKSEANIRKLIRLKKLPFSKLNDRTLRIKVSDLIDYYKSISDRTPTPKNIELLLAKIESERQLAEKRGGGNSEKADTDSNHNRSTSEEIINLLSDDTYDKAENLDNNIQDKKNNIKKSSNIDEILGIVPDNIDEDPSSNKALDSDTDNIRDRILGSDAEFETSNSFDSFFSNLTEEKNTTKKTYEEQNKDESTGMHSSSTNSEQSINSEKHRYDQRNNSLDSLHEKIDSLHSLMHLTVLPQIKQIQDNHINFQKNHQEYSNNLSVQHRTLQVELSNQQNYLHQKIDALHNLITQDILPQIQQLSFHQANHTQNTNSTNESINYLTSSHSELLNYYHILRDRIDNLHSLLLEEILPNVSQIVKKSEDIQLNNTSGDNDGNREESGVEGEYIRSAQTAEITPQDIKTLEEDIDKQGQVQGQVQEESVTPIFQEKLVPTEEGVLDETNQEINTPEIVAENDVQKNDEIETTASNKDTLMSQLTELVESENEILTRVEDVIEKKGISSATIPVGSSEPAILTIEDLEFITGEEQELLKEIRKEEEILSEIIGISTPKDSNQTETFLQKSSDSNNSNASHNKIETLAPIQFFGLPFLNAVNFSNNFSSQSKEVKSEVSIKNTQKVINNWDLSGNNQIAESSQSYSDLGHSVNDNQTSQNSLTTSNEFLHPTQNSIFSNSLPQNTSSLPTLDSKSNIINFQSNQNGINQPTSIENSLIQNFDNNLSHQPILAQSNLTNSNKSNSKKIKKAKIGFFEAIKTQSGKNKEVNTSNSILPDEEETKLDVLDRDSKYKEDISQASDNHFNTQSNTHIVEDNIPSTSDGINIIFHTSKMENQATKNDEESRVSRVNNNSFQTKFDKTQNHVESSLRKEVETNEANNNSNSLYSTDWQENQSSQTLNNYLNTQSDVVNSIQSSLSGYREGVSNSSSQSKVQNTAEDSDQEFRQRLNKYKHMIKNPFTTSFDEQLDNESPYYKNNSIPQDNNKIDINLLPKPSNGVKIKKLPDNGDFVPEEEMPSFITFKKDPQGEDASNGLKQNEQNTQEIQTYSASQEASKPKKKGWLW